MRMPKQSITLIDILDEQVHLKEKWQIEGAIVQKSRSNLQVFFM